MKRLMTIILCLSLLLITACSQGDSSKAEAGNAMPPQTESEISSLSEAIEIPSLSISESSAENDSSISSEFSQEQSAIPSQNTPASSSQSENSPKPDSSKLVLTPSKSVYLLNDEKIEISMQNNDISAYFYGPTYELEFWDGTKWIRLERKESEQRNWNQEPGLIESGELHQPALEFYLEEYENLTPGQYRAITHGTLPHPNEPFVPSTSGNSYTFTAEFAIES